MDAREMPPSRHVPARLRPVVAIALTALFAGIAAGCIPKGVTVGTAQYSVPSGAIVVSPAGNDANAGTSSKPLRTVNAAVARARSGGTIVLRAGSYHESVVMPPDRRLTLQSWPKEAAWLEGSSVVTGWAANGSRWVRTGWNLKFDHSPTYTRGAPDGTAANWGFLNPSYPLAAHPDQIWINGVAQRQVGSLGAVVAGTFFHDENARQLWLGTNPNGKQVRVSDLVKALSVRSTASVVRGIGIRRYAPSVPDMAAVTIESPSVVMENVAITDNSTTGLHIGSGTTANVVLRNLTLARNGMLGLNASQADNLKIERIVSEGNNTERFNTSPVAGGAKIGRTRNVIVRDSIFRNNYGTGLWMDESVYNMTIVGNEMRSNAKHGVSLEISAKAVFANNIVTNNTGYGAKLNNTSGLTVWNNTFVGNDRSINLVQDSRRPTSPTSAGRDKRQPFPDPTMTWLIGPAVFANNIVANQRLGNCMICVEDTTLARSAAQIGATANGNVYNRSVSSSPTVLVVWSRAGTNPATYTSTTAFRSATGQEANGQFISGRAIVDANGKRVGSLSNTAVALPSSVAAVTGKPTGTRYQGAWPH
jgi:parallel beta-helix repeat protein